MYYATIQKNLIFKHPSQKGECMIPTRGEAKQGIAWLTPFTTDMVITPDHIGAVYTLTELVQAYADNRLVEPMGRGEIFDTLVGMAVPSSRDPECDPIIYGMKAMGDIADALLGKIPAKEDGVIKADEVTLKFFRKYLKMPKATLEEMCREIIALKGGTR